MVSRRHSPVEPKLGKDLDLSYVDPELGRPPVSCVIRHCAASIAIYTTLLGLVLVNPWFRGLLEVSIGRVTGFHFYLGMYLAYVLVTPVVCLVFRPHSLWVSKNVLIVAYMARLLKLLLRAGSSRDGWQPTYKEKHALMFLLIKLIYGPLMFNSACFSYNDVARIIPFFKDCTDSIERLDLSYAVFVSGIFLVDSMLFCFCYHAEAGFLRSRVRYVETRLFSVLVCIMCYPPFNQVTVSVLGPSNYSEMFAFHGDLHHPATWILRAFAVFFLAMLIASSLSLFTKASNLTNRGIVTWGPYCLIRHPGYVAKNMFWLVTLIPILVNVDPSAPQFSWTGYGLFCLATIMGFVGWCTVYVLRSLTEERLLMADPEYVAYCKKVRYRFIPWVF